MQGYFAAAVMILLLTMILLRARIMKKQGIKVISFGEIDKKDFFIPPFFFLFMYFILANTFDWPWIFKNFFFSLDWLRWAGVFVCGGGLTLLLLSLISFGQPFRIGIDEKKPDKLVTTGVFALSRNPIYTAFGLVMFGMFLIFPNAVFLVYFIAAILLFNRQVLLEEEYLKKHYGEEYLEYCREVQRYLFIADKHKRQLR